MAADAGTNVAYKYVLAGAAAPFGPGAVARSRGEGGTVRSPWLAGAVLCALAAASATAADRYASAGLLERRDWWPFETGPRYGEVPEALRDHPRVVRLEVGSFDTRGPGLDIPRELALTGESSLAPGTPWLVQLDGPITEGAKEALRAAGATIRAYRPSYTFVVRAADPAALARLPGVVWTGPYHPAYRIEPTLGHGPTFDPEVASNERIYVRALLFEADERHAVAERLAALGASVDARATFDPSERAGGVYFTAAPDLVLAASRMSEVYWIEEVSREGIALNAESKVVLQSGFVDNGTPFWDAGVDGSTQVVAVMDSGLDVDTILVSHTASDAGTPGPGHRKVVAYTPHGGGDRSTCPGVCFGIAYEHGTNTSQCAVGNRTDFGQNGDLEGVAKKARIVFQDIQSATCANCVLGGLSPPSNLFAAYDEVRANGGHLFNGSFAICSYGTYGSHARDADQYAWDHKDFLTFFSGGNGGSGNACPGTNKNNVSSGGHYQDPFQNEFYGSTGPCPDNRMCPTVLGPACDHANGNPAPFNYDTSTSIQSNDNDITGAPSSTVRQGSCGTSFSSPYLMGAAALVRDYFEKGYAPTGTAQPADAFAPSGALVKAVLMHSGEFVESCTGCARPGLMGSMGMGRANLSSALPIAGDSRTPRGICVVDRGMAEGLATGGLFEKKIEVADATDPFRVTLDWVDREGSTLTNDLRLTVIGPGGGPGLTYHGGNFDSAFQGGRYTKSDAAGGTTDDHTNVFEAVRVPPGELVAGTWTIRVQGTNVPMGDPAFGDTQPFALVASGGFDTATPEVSGPGSASPLVVAATDATSVTWQWEDIAGGGESHHLYRGSLGSLRGGVYDHGVIGPSHCGLPSSTTTLTDKTDGLDSYYLAGAHRNCRDGSLGGNSAAAERPPASPACP